MTVCVCRVAIEFIPFTECYNIADAHALTCVQQMKCAHRLPTDTALKNV